MLKTIILLLMVLTFSTIGFADVMSPDGVIRDHFGTEEFITKKMVVEKMDSATMFKIWTNYPFNRVTYNISDFQLKISEEKILAVKMSGKNKGDILLNPTWHTSEVFKDIGEFCRTVNGDFINTFATGGTVIGKAIINIEKLKDKEYLVTIIIPNKYLDGMSGFASFTPAWCGNSIVTEGFSVAKAPQCCPTLPYTIDPSFKNDNPVVPYWSGVPYYGGWYGGYGCDYPYPFGYGDGGDKPNPPPVPIPTSGLFLLTGLVFLMKKHL